MIHLYPNLRVRKGNADVRKWLTCISMGPNRRKTVMSPRPWYLSLPRRKREPSAARSGEEICVDPLTFVFIVMAMKQQHRLATIHDPSPSGTQR